jgi:hypothetical protein
MSEKRSQVVIDSLTTVVSQNRYLNSFLQTAKLEIEYQYIGTKLGGLIQEQNKLGEYITRYGKLPPGNKVPR